MQKIFCRCSTKGVQFVMDSRSFWSHYYCTISNRRKHIGNKRQDDPGILWICSLVNETVILFIPSRPNSDLWPLPSSPPKAPPSALKELIQRSHPIHPAIQWAKRISSVANNNGSSRINVPTSLRDINQTWQIHANPRWPTIINAQKLYQEYRP